MLNNKNNSVKYVVIISSDNINYDVARQAPAAAANSSMEGILK